MSTDDITLQRNLPHNIEAERSLLGAILIENHMLNQAQEILRDEDFYREGHRTIFRIMADMSERSSAIDLVTLKEELARDGSLESVGGAPYISSLVDGVPRSANVEHYAKIVKEKAILRNLIGSANKILNRCFEGEEGAIDLLDEAQKEIFALAEGNLRSGFVHLREVAAPTLDYIDKLHKHQELITGLSTGYERVDELTSGLQRTDLIIVAGRPSMGKAQPLDARIKTVTGWKRMGDLRMGDEIASVDGRRSLVSGIFPQGVRQAYRVTFSDGRSTECCGEHLWRVMYRGWEAPRILTTDELREKLTRVRYRNRLWIDTVEGSFGHREPLPVDPYVLGALLGDGSLLGAAVRSSNADDDLLERLAERLGEVHLLSAAGGYDYRIVTRAGSHRKGLQGTVPNALEEGLRSLGIWGLRSERKFIPESYLTASREKRLDLLRGLLDTDGWVETLGAVRFCTSSERLADEVVALVRSLGGTASRFVKQPRYSYRGEKRDGLPAYVCNIQHADPASLFSLERKRERVAGGRARMRRLTIESIEPTRLTEMQCISVTHPSRLYVTDEYIVTHNTAFALNVAQNVGIKLGKHVGVFSLEMSREQVFLRMLSGQARVDAHQLRTGRLGREDWSRLTMAFGELTEAPIYIDDTAGITIFEMRAKARRLKAEKGLDLLIVDYLQLVRGRERYENRNQEISDISRSLKAIAKELSIPVIAVSQLSRAPEQRGGDHRPQLADLRESGAIEQDADVVFLLFREEYYKPDKLDVQGLAEVNIAKQRNGPTGRVDLVFIREYARFENPDVSGAPLP